MTAAILRSHRPMKLPAPLLLAAALFCARLSADQALFRNSGIGFGGGCGPGHEGSRRQSRRKTGRDSVPGKASASQSACSVITMFGNGDGTFRAPVKTPIASCGSVAFGDLDSDGNVDVVLSGYDDVLSKSIEGTAMARSLCDRQRIKPDRLSTVARTSSSPI